jgi:alkylation response protein AidB-like acyl-CoA dehydrogenase
LVSPSSAKCHFAPRIEGLREPILLSIFEFSSLGNQHIFRHRLPKTRFPRRGPEKYGGSNLGFLAHTLVTEELAKVIGSRRVSFNTQPMGMVKEIYQ